MTSAFWRFSTPALYYSFINWPKQIASMRLFSSCNTQNYYFYSFYFILYAYFQSELHCFGHKIKIHTYLFFLKFTIVTLAVLSLYFTNLGFFFCKARLDSTQWRQSFRGWRALRVTVFPFHDTTRTLKWNTFSYYIFCLVISSDSIKWKGF